jgi:hypothetical protein
MAFVLTIGPGRGPLLAHPLSHLMSLSGVKQKRYLFELLYESEEPMTFAAIRRAAAGDDFVFRLNVERSLRRNLKRMVDSEVVVANGDRYCIHPRILAIMDAV